MHGSQISSLESRIWNLESRISLSSALWKYVSLQEPANMDHVGIGEQHKLLEITFLWFLEPDDDTHPVLSNGSQLLSWCF